MFKPFKASDFQATQFTSAEQKAKFANHFVRFVASGYKSTLFYTWFYRELSNTFGHIAHYNRCGFYVTWFNTAEHRLEFWRHMSRYRVCGDPKFTHSDVERTLKMFYGFDRSQYDMLEPLFKVI